MTHEMVHDSMHETMHELSLLSDDALVVRVRDRLRHRLTAWLPFHARPTSQSSNGPRAAVIEIGHARDAAPGVARAGASPIVVFGGVRATEAGPELLVLEGASGVRGEIALDARLARITLPDLSQEQDPRADNDLYSMLTLSAAFLAGRIGAALVHAGAVVDPAGRAWLLVGDTHAGKTSTCVSLVDAGWRFLADDQVVLRSDAQGVTYVEGWPRLSHLDEGWASETVSGTRAAVDLRRRWSDRWLRRAPLGGIFLPTVNADSPTVAAPAHAATAFTALVRQSPWLIVDKGAARDVMSLLRSAAAGPVFALSLGRDSYARGSVLADRLASAYEPTRDAAR